MTFTDRLHELAMSVVLDPKSTDEDLKAAREAMQFADVDYARLSDTELDNALALASKAVGVAPEAHDPPPVSTRYPSCMRCYEFSDEDLEDYREAIAEDESDES